MYQSGLSGPFLFDDHVHITQNRWVHIDSLDWADLAQAWNSSFSSFPADRPLAQLTFGINHAVSGLDTLAFKLTNLGFHLLTGVAVFWLTRLVARALNNGRPDPRIEVGVAALTCAFWLLHPMHVSTVLYTVQRMAQISTLGTLVALACYFTARLRVAEGRSAIAWFAAVPVTGLAAFLGKENAVLLPLFLLVSEVTVLRNLTTGTREPLVRGVWVLFIAAPLLLGVYYLLSHPGLYNYSNRPFTLEERVLTQARILWHYLHWLFVPDIRSFGLFHDDIALSTSLTQPVSTVIAISAHATLLAVALLSSRRWPTFAFAVLFFYAAHALESTILPLEMVFEHRNYLASVGPLFLLAYAIAGASGRLGVTRLAWLFGALLLAAYAAVTFVRVDNWSSFEKFVVSGVSNHPDSARYNFIAAKTLIGTLNRHDAERPLRADIARRHLERGLAADPTCTNCLFGLLVLDLHLDRVPSDDLMSRLTDVLRDGRVDATTLSVGQFSFLVKWQKSGASTLTDEQLRSIFDTALDNRGWNHTGRAGIHAAYREYLATVVGDLDGALEQADKAISTWPEQWAYHVHKVELLMQMQRYDEALAAIDAAMSVSDNNGQRARLEQLLQAIRQAADVN
ncbi:MAG: tetratricopeptide repeat protein [Gammaproteobacteria bacterium]|nr:tetratricopeptide repeat protein [Gammaproteobacteria bacterium]